jgi:hypothetical protein
LSFRARSETSQLTSSSGRETINGAGAVSS